MTGKGWGTSIPVTPLIILTGTTVLPKDERFGPRFVTASCFPATVSAPTD